MWQRQPLRVVVGGAARVSPEAAVFQQNGQTPCYLYRLVYRSAEAVRALWREHRDAARR
jgi:riboflavin biosynthesis pyrimidine reductase